MSLLVAHLGRNAFHRAYSTQACLVLPVIVEDSADGAPKTTAM